MSSYEQLRAQGPAAFADETGRTRYWELLAAERATMRDPVTGSAREDLVEHVACAACGQDRPYGGFVKDGFRYVRCESCGTLYVNPQLTEEAMMRFWTSSPVSEAWTGILRHPAQREWDEAKFATALDGLVEAGLSGARLLDFGCSIGTFLALARERGFEVAGIEPGDGARSIARDLFGLELFADMSALHPLARFDVITLWEVVEHTKDPLLHLQQLRQRITSAGRLVALVGGNAASLANRVMRGASAAFEFARPWYFTPDSFSLLLARAGWGLVDTHQMLDEIDVVQAYLRYGDPYQPSRLDDEVLPEVILDDLRGYALSHGMGYKFQVTAVPL